MGCDSYQPGATLQRRTFENSSGRAKTRQKFPQLRKRKHPRDSTSAQKWLIQ
jgi:hypothetical protein